MGKIKNTAKEKSVSPASVSAKQTTKIKKSHVHTTFI